MQPSAGFPWIRDALMLKKCFGLVCLHGLIAAQQRAANIRTRFSVVHKSAHQRWLVHKHPVHEGFESGDQLAKQRADLAAASLLAPDNDKLRHLPTLHDTPLIF